jgi:hypothetical protein
MGTAPATVKDVSENPSAKGLSAPTDPALKAADTERKMKFYGVIEAFRQGKFPSNSQIDETLRYVCANSPIDESKLSPDGKHLIEDVREIIETARLMVREKNEGELAQNFLFHTRHIDAQGHAQNFKELANDGPSREEAKNDGQAAAENLRTLAKLIYTSSETRKLLKDISIIGRDIAADAAIKAADHARPGEHELNQVDEPAPAGEWIGPNGERYGANDPVPDTGLAAKRAQAKEAKEKAVAAKNEAQANVQSEANDVASAAQAHGQDAANRVDAANSNGNARQEGAGVAQEKRDVAGSVATEKQNKLKGALGNLTGKIPQEHKDRARQARADGREYFDGKFPQERRDRFIYRLKKVIVEQQRHRDYQEAVEFFLAQAESYQAHAKGVTASGGSKATDVRADPAFQQAENEMRTLLERFANGASMTPMFEAVNQIYLDAQEDPELREWFKALDRYVRRVLQEPGYVMKEQCDADGRQIRDSGKKFWSERYASHRENLFSEIEKFFTSYADDPLNVQFGQNWKKLTKDLFLNSDGNFELKPHLWQDITGVILPELLRNVGYIPIPRIEYTDNQLDLVIENLTLEGQNLLPNIVEVDMRNHFKLSAYEKIQNASQHSFWISFSQIQADLRDVAFYVNKKTGFPKIRDSGLADVVISGKGVSGKVHVESSTSNDRVFVVKDVKAKVGKLTFAIRDSKHNMLYSIVRPLATGLIKKQIQKAIEDGIRSALTQLDAQFVDIRERMDAAQGAEGQSKLDIIKDTFSSKKSEAESVKSKAEPKGTFQLVAKRDSKLVDWSSPNSIIEKQGLKADEAAKSDHGGWKSDAFGIVPGGGHSVSDKLNSAGTAASTSNHNGANPALTSNGHGRSDVPAGFGDKHHPVPTAVA